MDVTLITGGSGYFGSLLLRKCLARGQACRVFDLNDAEDRPSQVEFIQGDVRDLEALKRAFVGVRVVHHNVAQVPLAKDRHLFDSVNRQGTANVLEASRMFGVKKVIYTSSSAVYGVPKSNPVTESTPPHPEEAYGRAKLEGETLCHGFSEKGLDITIIRPRTIVGHGRLGIFQILFEWIQEGVNVPVLGDGSNRYQFVHADDLAEACLLAAERPGSTSYNCGAEKFGSMRQVLESLCAHARTGSGIRQVPLLPAVWGMKVSSALGLSPLGPYHAMMYGRSMFFDITKARTELGWSPRYSNEEMFRESYDWYLKHRGEVLSGAGKSPHRSAVKQGVLGLVKQFLK